jgi:hypothetical protein
MEWKRPLRGRNDAGRAEGDVAIMCSPMGFGAHCGLQLVDGAHLIRFYFG